MISEGVTTIEWKTEATKSLSEEIKEKQANAESSGLTWIRENDVLTQCLGPEQPGRVRGVSSYNGWKEAWPEHSDMYRKRRKISSADLLAMKETMKEELKAELTKDILSMLAAHGLQIVPISRTQALHPDGGAAVRLPLRLLNNTMVVLQTRKMEMEMEMNMKMKFQSGWTQIMIL